MSSSVNGRTTDSSSGFDAVVVGGGSAGLAFAKRASSLGARVALIEEDELGGTCVNRGCVPKKLLWHVAHVRRTEEALVESGHVLSVPPLDLGRTQAAIGQHIAGLRDGFADALDDCGVTLLRGRAGMDGQGRVMFDGDVLSAERVVIACGSEPTAPDVPGLELADLSHDVFSWREVPERLLILGGGYIGVEFASIFSGFGTEIGLADEGEEILEGFDKDAIVHVRRHLERDGVTFEFGTALASIERSSNALMARLENGREFACDRVLFAVGRQPRIAGLGSIADALEYAESGALAVSDGLETSKEGVFAIGDAADRMPLTPVARRDGQWLADSLFAAPEQPLLDLDLVATVAYSDPPIAQVGRLEPGGLNVTHADVSPLKDGLLRQVDGRNAGDETFFYKLLTEGEDGPVRGAALVSRSAANEISWAAAAIAGGLTRRAMALPGAVHPSFTEEFIG